VGVAVDSYCHQQILALLSKLRGEGEGEREREK
jgi:hypothetical protein